MTTITFKLAWSWTQPCRDTMGRLAALTMLLVVSGCATSTSVLLGERPAPKVIETAALSPDHGNSPEMDDRLRDALQLNGIKIVQKVGPGTRTTKNAPVIVTYSDDWSWDVVMFFESVTITIYDGTSGEMLVSGRWKNSAAHGLHDPATVLNELVSAMIARLKEARPVREVVTLIPNSGRITHLGRYAGSEAVAISGARLR